MAPRMGRKRTWSPTENEMQYGRKESGAMGIPKQRARPSGPAASAAREAMYGPRKTVPTVVLNAELAQSYMAQPKISRLSFVVACGVVITPPEKLVLKLLSIKTPFIRLRLRKYGNVIESSRL